MKKKLLAVIILFTVALSATSCGNNAKETIQNSTNENTEEMDVSIDNSNDEKAGKDQQIDYTGYKEYYFNGYKFMIPQDWTLFMNDDSDNIGMYDFSTEDNLGIFLFSYGEENVTTADDMREYSETEISTEEMTFNGFECTKWSVVYKNELLDDEKYPYFHSDYYLFDNTLELSLEAGDDVYGREIAEKILNSIEKVD